MIATPITEPTYEIYCGFDFVTHTVPCPQQMVKIIDKLEFRGFVIKPNFVDYVRSKLLINSSFLKELLK